MTGETSDPKPKTAAKQKPAPKAPAATIVPNNNPALTVATLGDAPTFMPILAWSIGEGSPVPITPDGEQPLDDTHVLHDNAQRKYLVGGAWVRDV